MCRFTKTTAWFQNISFSWKRETATTAINEQCKVNNGIFFCVFVRAEKMAKLTAAELAALKSDLEALHLSSEGSEEILKDRLATAKMLAAASTTQRQINSTGEGLNFSLSSGAFDGLADQIAQLVTTQNTQMTFKDIDGSIPKFSGDKKQNVEKWIAKFEENADVYEWTERAKLVYAKRLMTDTAKRFIELECTPKTWDEMKYDLIAEFKMNASSAQVHKQLMERKKKKDESYLDYSYEMMAIAKQADIDTKSIITYIADGVSGSPVNKAFLYTSNTIKELKQNLVTYELVLEKNNKGDGAEQKKKDNGDSKKQQHQKSKGANCYNCGDPTHDQTGCPHKERGPKCFKCNDFGHKSTQCTKSGSNKDSVPKMNTIQRYNVEKDVTVNDNPIRALMDTGSEVTAIRKNVFHRLKLGVLDKNSSFVKGVGGYARTSGSFDAKIVIDGLEFRIHAK